MSFFDFINPLIGQLLTPTEPQTVFDMPVPDADELLEQVMERAHLAGGDKIEPYGQDTVRSNVRFLFSEIGFPLDEDLIIFGLSDDDPTGDHPNDVIGMMTPDAMKVGIGTLGPGAYYTKKQKGHPKFGGCYHLWPARPASVRLPKETALWGYHKNCWSVGTHRGWKPSLMQRNGKVLIYADVDASYDFTDGDLIKRVWDGIDFHPMFGGKNNVIYRQSAACWGIFDRKRADPKNHLEAMKVIMSADRFKKSKRASVSLGLIQKELADEVMGSEFFTMMMKFAAGGLRA